MPNIADILKGSQNAGSRLIRLIEDNDQDAFELLRQLYPHSGNAFIIGITGPPGVGKSTLIDSLISQFRRNDKKIGILAVDPTSPYSGGAILGDRLRMQRHSTDDKVFIRSMASRGYQGGLSRAVKDAAVIIDAMGYDIIIIETVGAGQSEIDISKLAHSIGVVNIPGTGDGIQAVKAGILETGDLFVVNKGDKPGANESVQQLKMMIEMRDFERGAWKPVVIKTSAATDAGIETLADAFLSHFEFMNETGELEIKKKELAHFYFKSVLRDLTVDRVLKILTETDSFQAMVHKIESHELDPFNAAKLLSKKIVSVETINS